jgi:hypothetical protein
VEHVALQHVVQLGRLEYDVVARDLLRLVAIGDTDCSFDTDLRRENSRPYQDAYSDNRHDPE